jgi:hypothetical protein
MFMSYNTNDVISATRLNADGTFAWPGDRVVISSTTTSPGTPKMRFGFAADGPNRCVGTWTESRGSGYLGYAQGISTGGLIGIVVATLGGIPATIITPGGTLQMVATVFPAAANQNVTWSVVPGTGGATINAAGLVTAQLNGSVWAKATAVQDNTVIDSLLITISGQTVTTPIVTTLDATNISLFSATLNGLVTANSYPTNVTFEWGTTSSYGNTLAANPQVVTGTSAVLVTSDISGLTAGTVYHFRCVGENQAGIFYGEDKIFFQEVGQQELAQEKVRIYPVPSHGQFRVVLTSQAMEDVTICIFNPAGEKILETDPVRVSGTIEKEIDLRSAPGGVYAILILSGNRTQVKKVLIGDF